MASPSVLPSPSIGSDGSWKCNWTNWELNCINNAAGTRSKGGCTVNLNNVADNSFNLVVQLMGSTSDVCNNVVKVIKKKRSKNGKKNLLTMCPEPCPFASSKNQEYTQKKWDFQSWVWPSWRYRVINTIQQRIASEQVAEQVFKQVEETEDITEV